MPATTIADPAVRQFVSKVAASTGAVPDAVAGLLLKLCARTSALERVVKEQAPQLDRLSRQSQALLPADLPPPPPGFDAEGDTPRPVGRPKGRRDGHPRRVPQRAAGDSGTRWLIDAGFDDLGG
jgi:hypothetical protein